MANSLERMNCDVAVIGAGLAGLAAADALAKEGVNVLVFEREQIVGGRVLTCHKPNGTHFELGAFSFGDSEKTLWDFIHRFSLEAIPHTAIDREFTFEGIRGRFSDRASPLLGRETELKFSQLLQSCLDNISDTEDTSFEQALQQAGASEKVIRWLEKNTLPGLLGEGFHSVSSKGTLQYFRQYLESRQFYAVKGGNDQIPQAIARELDKKVCCQFQITRIERCATGWLMQGAQAVFAEQIIFAIPVPAMKQIVIHPPLSERKQQALAQVRFTPCSRISVTAPPGILGEARGGVFASSNGWFRDQTAFQRSPHTVFNQSFVGKEAQRINQMEQQELRRDFLASLRDFIPHFEDESLEYHLHSWDNVEWIQGGYSYLPPQTFHFKDELANPEGSLFFAESTPPISLLR